MAAAAADAGVTVMSLTDHDAVAGVPDAIAAAEQGGNRMRAGRRDVLRPRLLRRSAHAAAIGWTSTRSLRPANAPRGNASDRAREIIERLNGLGVEVSFEAALAEAGAADSIGRPHIARAAGAGPDLGPFFEEYLVPGREGVRGRDAGRPPRRPSS